MGESRQNWSQRGFVKKAVLFFLLLLVAAAIVLRYCPDDGGRPPEEGPPLLPSPNERIISGGPLFVPSVGCSNSELFVDVKEGSRPVGEGFDEALRRVLENSVRADFCHLFGPGVKDLNTLGCLWYPREGRYRQPPREARLVRVATDVVFKPRPSLQDESCFLHDGHRRFFRVRFAYGEKTVDIPETSLCRLTELARAAADEAALATAGNQPLKICGLSNGSSSGLNGAADGKLQFDIGRECAVRALSNVVEGAPVSELERSGMLDWHLKRLQPVPSPGPSVQQAPPKIWLVDTGVYPGVAAALGVAGASTTPGELLDPHGSAMAALLRQVVTSTRVEIASVPVFDERFRSKTSVLARALESIYAANLDEPNRLSLINLSLGWPTPLSSPEVPRTLCGLVATTYNPDKEAFNYEECVSSEGPLGGAVRFGLALIRFGNPNAVIVAAPGNASLPFVEPTDPQRRSQLAAFLGPQMACGRTNAIPDLLDEEALFYPAEWGRPSAAEARFDPFTRKMVQGAALVTPAGAVDGYGRRVPTTRPSGLLPLELPGQHVFVSGQALLALVGTDPSVRGPGYACAADGSGVAPDPAERFALKVPSSWTGTSISTVLLTGVAAEAHSLWVAETRKTIGWGQLLTLLRVTGRPLDEGRTGVTPSLCRIQASLDPESSKSCRLALNACVGRASVEPESADRALASDVCSQARDICGPVWDRCPVDLAPSRWPESFELTPCPTVQSPLMAVPTSQPKCPIVGGPCLELEASGEIGPQPGGGVCRECSQRSLKLAMSPQYPPGTTFTSPRLRFYDETGKAYEFELRAANGQATEWRPGERIVIPELPLQGIEGRVVRGILYVVVTRPGELSVIAESALRIEQEDERPSSEPVPH